MQAPDILVNRRGTLREVEQLAARWVHNPKAVGSNPALATIGGRSKTGVES